MDLVWPKKWRDDFVNRYRSIDNAGKPRLARYLADIPRDYSDNRTRIEFLVGRVADDSGRTKLIKRLRAKDDFQSAIRELRAVGDLLDRGITLSYELDIDGKTPDWAVLDKHHHPIGIVEFVECGPSAAVRKRDMADGRLFERLGECEAAGDMCVFVDSSDTNELLSDGQIHEICQRTVQWLAKNRPKPDEELLVHGIRMIACKRPFPEVGIAPFGSGHVSPRGKQHLVEALHRKVSSYRGICNRHHLPLAVIIYADHLTCLNVGDWFGATCGDMATNFDEGPFLLRPNWVTDTSTFAQDRELSAAGWLALHADQWQVSWLFNPLANLSFDNKVIAAGPPRGRLGFDSGDRNGVCPLELDS